MTTLLLVMDAEAVITAILQRLRLTGQQLTKARALAMLTEYPVTPGELKRFWQLFDKERAQPRVVRWFMKLYETRDTKRGWEARGKHVRPGSSGSKTTFFTRRDAGRIRAALASGGSVKALARVFRTVQQFETATLYTRKQVK